MKIDLYYRRLVKERDIEEIRLVLKDYLTNKQNLKYYDVLVDYTMKHLDNFYDTHNGELFEGNIHAWCRLYIDEQLHKLIINFSKERVYFIRMLLEVLEV